MSCSLSTTCLTLLQNFWGLHSFSAGNSSVISVDAKRSLRAEGEPQSSDDYLWIHYSKKIYIAHTVAFWPIIHLNNIDQSSFEGEKNCRVYKESPDFPSDNRRYVLLQFSHKTSCLLRKGNNALFSFFLLLSFASRYSLYCGYYAVAIIICIALYSHTNWMQQVHSCSLGVGQMRLEEIYGKAWADVL